MQASSDYIVASKRRETRSGLHPAGQAFVESFDLAAPTAARPGFWRSDDDFLAVNVGVVRKTTGKPGERVRVLISFEGNGLQKMARKLVRKEFPDRAGLSESERRRQWVRILQIGKQVRTQRVLEIVRTLHSEGIEIDPTEITVHRVSNTFFATLTVKSLRRIASLRAMGYQEFRRIQASKLV